MNTMSINKNIKLRQLGQTDIYISPIGLGCWQFSEGKGGAAGTWAPISVEETNGIVQAVLNGGINWFDTAELYGWGRSERAIAQALKKSGKIAQEVIVATKWNPIGRTAWSITRTIGKRQECLDPYTIDLYQIHAPFGFTTRRSEMNAMADLVESEKIRSVGISNYSARQMRQAHEVLRSRGLRLVSNQVRFNLLDRSIEANGILDTAKELGVTIIAYSPLGLGLLTGKFHKTVRRMSADPIVIAKVINEAINAKNPKTRYVKGPMARTVIWYRHTFGDKAFDDFILQAFYPETRRSLNIGTNTVSYLNDGYDINLTYNTGL